VKQNNFRMAPAYGGGPVTFPLWGKVIFDNAGVYHGAKLPALREHARDRNVGIISQVTVEGQALYAEGRFSESTPDGREVAALAKEGFPWQASVAIWPDEVQEISAGETVEVNGLPFDGPGIVVRKGHLREISFVALGLDPDTSAVSMAASLPGGVTMGKTEQCLADQEISRLARELAQREGLTLDLATERIFAERPELAQAWLKNVI
jgi:hypothetical protein